MFHEKEMGEALFYLISLFDEVDASAFERQSDDELIPMTDFTMHDLCQALYQCVETPYEYRAALLGEKSSGHVGRELFEKRAVLLVSALQDYRDNDWILKDHSYELWMTEDLSFYVVDAVQVTIHLPGKVFHTEYRGIKWRVEDSDDLPFNPLDFIDSMDEICCDFANSPTHTM